jgi:hypothetical protein
MPLTVNVEWPLGREISTSLVFRLIQIRLQSLWSYPF